MIFPLSEVGFPSVLASPFRFFFRSLHVFLRVFACGRPCFPLLLDLRRVPTVSDATCGFTPCAHTLPPSKSFRRFPSRAPGPSRMRRLTGASNRTSRVTFLALSCSFGPTFKIRGDFGGSCAALARRRPPELDFEAPGLDFRGRKPLIFVLFRRLRAFGANFIRSVQNTALANKN